MRTADERSAAFLLEHAFRTVSVGDVAKMLRDYAADMRTACAQRVCDKFSERDYPLVIARDAENAVRSTPFPGEQ